MKYKYLEFLRGFAAITVLVNHIIGKLPVLERDRPLILQAIGAWGTEAVIIFFVLSGVVINHIQTQKPVSTIEFLKKRAIRILPIYYICVLLALIVDHFTLNAAGYHDILGTAFFVATLSGSLTFPITTIIVVWSLSYEIFFYVTFSLLIGKQQKKLIFIWFVISLACCVPYYFNKENIIYEYLINMFSFSSLWLLGYYIYEFKDSFKTNLSTALFAGSLVPITTRLHLSNDYYNIGIFICTAFLIAPLFLLALNRHLNSTSTGRIFIISHTHCIPFYLIVLTISVFFSESLLISKVLYGLLPIASLLFLIPFFLTKLKKCIKSVERLIIFTGRISFALYLVHLPIIYVFGALWPDSLFFNLILIVLFSFLISIFLETYYQKKWVALFQQPKKPNL